MPTKGPKSVIPTLRVPVASIASWGAGATAGTAVGAGWELPELAGGELAGAEPAGPDAGAVVGAASDLVSAAAPSAAAAAEAPDVSGALAAGAVVDAGAGGAWVAAAPQAIIIPTNIKSALT